MFNDEQVLKGTYIQQTPWGSSGGSLRIHLPELMPKIPAGLPNSTQISLDRSCYSNANDCKPAVSSQVTTQNYVTAQAPYHSYQLPYYPYGAAIAVHSRNFDCLTCRLSPEEIDNSFDPYP